MKTAKEILIEARAKIQNPENWTKGVYARAKSGKETLPNSKDAVSYCSIGAIFSVLNFSSSVDSCYISYQQQKEYYVAFASLTDCMSEISGSRVLTLSLFNDDPNTTHEEILDLFDRSIARL